MTLPVLPSLVIKVIFPPFLLCFCFLTASITLSWSFLPVTSYSSVPSYIPTALCAYSESRMYFFDPSITFLCAAMKKGMPKPEWNSKKQLKALMCDTPVYVSKFSSFFSALVFTLIAYLRLTYPSLFLHFFTFTTCRKRGFIGGSWTIIKLSPIKYCLRLVEDTRNWSHHRSRCTRSLILVRSSWRMTVPLKVLLRWSGSYSWVTICMPPF